MASHARQLTASDALTRLTRDDAVGQLRRRDGAMARLGSEDAALKLDWVEMTPWLLAHPAALAEVEREAQALLAKGVKSLIWAGMGGSVLSVRVARALGFADQPCAVLPLDSTDPAALNAIWSATSGLRDSAMIAVAMGMTSEEPISHLDWFASAASSAETGDDSRLVMALPDSFLDIYARERGLTRLPLQLDGGSGTGGRMSAPGTRVFLLPAALYLAGLHRGSGALADVLRAAWAAYDFAGAQTNPSANQWVRLACALAATAHDGAVRLTIETPPGWDSVRDWAEQLMEESLGKHGKGVVVFAPDALPPDATNALRLRIRGDTNSSSDAQPESPFDIHEPLITSPDGAERLAGLAALYMGLQLAMALYGYLWDIPFAGQPAVEEYKSRARMLRDVAGPDLARGAFDSAPLRAGPQAVYPPHRAPLATETPLALHLADWLRSWRAGRPLAYLDVTINGEASGSDLEALTRSLRILATERLAVPYKLRRAPAAYHSTEQSEMDGPVDVLSLRTLALRHETVASGVYTARFLEAQALATWQAMNAQGRPCILSLYDGDTAAMVESLRELLDAVAAELETPERDASGGAHSDG